MIRTSGCWQVVALAGVFALSLGAQVLADGVPKDDIDLVDCRCHAGIGGVAASGMRECWLKCEATYAGNPPKLRACRNTCFKFGADASGMPLGAPMGWDEVGS
ncbi:MAG: hypothetical protein KDA25_13170 [Phycisphaerales bacterium]|nr:hypothetical protein [Phycisphaerales bacterium]